MTHFFMSRPTAWAATLAAALLSGCASLPDDDGFGRADSVARQHLGTPLQRADRPTAPHSAAATLKAALAAPLTEQAAVQIAVTQHPGLQADLERLRAEAAEGALAASLPAPGFMLRRTRAGEELEWEASLHASLARLLALPWLREREAQRLSEAGHQAAIRVLQHALQARSAWLDAVAARQQAAVAQAALESAQASSTLAERMQKAGNFSALQAARIHLAQAQVKAAALAAAAQQRSSEARLRLALGLPAHTALTLPDTLPELPPQAPADLPDSAQQLAQRSDVQSAQARWKSLQSGARADQAQRWLADAEIGPEWAIEGPLRSGHLHSRSWELGLRLPFWDSRVRQVAADSRVRVAELELQQTQLSALADIQEAHEAARLQWQMAQHQQTVALPLARQIAQENLLRYNGMLIGVFELLDSAQQRLQAEQAAVMALRDYWLAQAQLQTALLAPPGRALTAAASASSSNRPAAAADSAGH